MTNSALSRAWAALTLYPVLAVVPALWELIGSALFQGLNGANQAASAASGTHSISVKFLLPSLLPAGSDLIGTAGRVDVHSIGGAAVLLTLLANVAGAFIAGGYLHLLSGALRGEAPTRQRFVAGLERYGSRLLGWNLLVFVAVMLEGALAAGSSGPGLLVFAGLMLLALFYLLVPFLIVERDLTLSEAITIAPSTFRSHLNDFLPVYGASLAASVISSLLLSAAGLNTILLAAPVWAWFGTWVALGVLSVLQEPGQ